MAEQEYKVRISADTKRASDKIDAVENSLNRITTNPYNIRVGVDANALRRSAEETSTIASNIRDTTRNIKEGSGTSVISGDTIARAATLASTFVGLKRDARLIQKDLGKALGQTNVSEFMRTEKFLNRIIDVSSSKTRDIAEVYQEIRAVPAAAELVGPLENFARSKAWETFGGDIAQQTLQGVGQGLRQGVQETKNFLYADLFNEIVVGTNQAIDTLARLGLAIQGVQLLIGPLAATWSAGFNAIIGQNVKLKETILATQTTLASTSRVINQATGEEITDPLSKINALEQGVNQAIDNIRVRSLDLAGVTSSQIIDVFGVVATSISQIGGNLKDAEDLAISFTAALGTLGIPLYQARQEIGSILGGYITEDSLLARRLQISNADINKAKGSIDGVVGYLQKKLSIAVAGQAISAKSFSGVLSNIQEVFEVATQRIGQPLLNPLVGGFTVIYNFLKKIQGLVIGIGTFLSSTIVKSITVIVEGIQKSKLVTSIGRSVEAIAQPFESLSRSIEMGFGNRNTDLVQEYLKGLIQVPAALKPFIDALLEIGRFLQQQVNLIVGPIVELLDQSRSRFNDIGRGAVEFFTRSTQFVLGEGPEAFTKGWDTIASTVQAATASLAKFGMAIVKLKITAFTAQIRAAAQVFELFGSMLLGKINLALSFFDKFGDVLQSDFAKFAVSVGSINKLLNNTEFFGLKGLLIWGIQTSKILTQLRKDIDLFIKGFKDAGNVNNLIKSTEAAYGRILGLQAKSKNPVIKNLAEIELVKKRLTELNQLQTQLASQTSSAVAFAKYGKDIKEAETQLANLTKTQQQFTKAQRAMAGVQAFVGGGAEMAQAKEAARQASVMASGAASAKALSSVMNTLGERLGLTREQMKGLGGAARVAGKSLQTFLTTTLLINIGFTAASIGIAALITYFQQTEERAKKLSSEMRNLATVNKILASGYSSIITAAEGGDVASQNLLSQEREAAQAALTTARTRQEAIKQRNADLNTELIQQRRLAAGLKGILPGDSTEGAALRMQRADAERRIGEIGKEITKNKKEEQKITEQIYKAQQAINKLELEQKLNQDLKLLGERRKDIEDRIKLAREDYNKELLDKEFQGRIEILNYEQQKRQEIANQEKAALSERFKLLSNNATENDRRTLALLEDYETAVLNSITEEERRRSEMMQKQMQLRKEIEDYAFKMTRERTQLEKQIGNYKKEMEVYQNRMQQVRQQKDVAHTRALLNLQQPYFKPYNLEQSQKFVNAAVDQGFDSRDAYAYLQMFPKSVLGVTGDEKIEVIMQRLRRVLDSRERAGFPNNLEYLAEDRLGVKDPKKFVAGLRAEATDALNSVISMWLTSNKNTDISAPNLNIDWQGQQARMRALSSALIEAFQGLQEVLKQGDTAEIQRAIERFADPSLYTDIKADYTNEIEQSKVNIQTFIGSLEDWNKGIVTVTQEIMRIANNTEARIRTIIKTRLSEKGLNEQTINAIIENYLNNKYNASNNPFDANTTDLLNSIRKGFMTAVSQAEQNFNKSREVEAQNRLDQLLRESFDIPNILNSRNQVLNQVLDRFDAIRAESGNGRYSLAETQRNIIREVENMVQSIVIKVGQPLNDDQLKALEAASTIYKNELLNQSSVLDLVNKTLEEYQKKLEIAKTLTDTFMQSTKTLYMDILTGSKSISEAMQNFSQSITNELLSISLEAVLTPMKQNVFAFLKNALGVDTAENKAQNALITAQTALTSATGNLKTSIDNLNTTISKTSSQLPISNPAATPTDSTNPTAHESAAARETQRTNAIVEETSSVFSNLTKVVGVTAQAFVGVSMGIAGFNQMKKGGTYNTLMGLAGIFGSLGSITGMFSRGGVLGGLFGGTRAAGGPVSANRPYLVGEQGPELFTSSVSGTILSNTKTRDYFTETRSSLQSQMSSELSTSSAAPPMAPIDIRFESQTINNVEYVTAEQHRKGMEMAAKRGQALAYQGLQHSVKVRRRLGVG